MNKAINAIGRIEHLANSPTYGNTAKHVEAIYGNLVNNLADVRLVLDYVHE